MSAPSRRAATRQCASRAAAALAIGCLAGCQSTVDTAKKITAQGQAAFSAKGVSVGGSDPRFRVGRSWVLQDQNGAAVVIQVRNQSHLPIADAPIAIDVLGRHRNSVFRNDTAGIELSLAHLPLMAPGQTLDWVNDQVQPSDTPVRVNARIGAGKTVAGVPAHFPLSHVNLGVDPTSGVELNGILRNTLSTLQQHVVICAVGRKGDRVVAAGRAIIQKVQPGKTQPFHIFFIGNPKGTRLSVSAAPTV